MWAIPKPFVSVEEIGKKKKKKLFLFICWGLEEQKP